MTARDSSSSLQLFGLALLVMGVCGAGIAYKQCASTQRQISSVQSEVVDEPLEAASMEAALTRPSNVVIVSSSKAIPTGVSSAPSLATARPEIDWEDLVGQKPEAALQQLKLGVPRDEVEAQRFSVYEVRALTKLQRMGEARARAETYFERWPSGPDVVFLQSLTGAHPRANSALDTRP
jgi:hypothetical protein